MPILAMVIRLDHRDIRCVCTIATTASFRLLRETGSNPIYIGLRPCEDRFLSAQRRAIVAVTFRNIGVAVQPHVVLDQRRRGVCRAVPELRRWQLSSWPRSSRPSPVLGILIPGTPILMAVAGAAAMAGQSMLPFLVLSIIGAVIGDFALVLGWAAVQRPAARRLAVFPPAGPDGQRRTVSSTATASTAWRSAGSCRCCGPPCRWSPAWRACGSGASWLANVASAFVWAPVHIYPAPTGRLVAWTGCGTATGSRRRLVGRRPAGLLRRRLGRAPGGRRPSALRSLSAAGRALGVDVERIQPVAGGHEQPVAEAAAETQVGARAPAARCGRSALPALSNTRTPSSSASPMPQPHHRLPSISTRNPSGVPGLGVDEDPVVGQPLAAVDDVERADQPVRRGAGGDHVQDRFIRGEREAVRPFDVVGHHGRLAGLAVDAPDRRRSVPARPSRPRSSR